MPSPPTPLPSLGEGSQSRRIGRGEGKSYLESATPNLPLESTIVARLADGSESEIPIYLAEIRWNEQVQFVTVLATGTKPLLGTALLQGFRLTIEFSADGMVQVERI